MYLKKNNWVQQLNAMFFKTQWKDSVYFYSTFQRPFEKRSGGTQNIQCFLQHFSYSFQIPAKGYSAFTKAKGTVFKCDGKDTVYFTSLFKAREGENDQIVT